MNRITSIVLIVILIVAAFLLGGALGMYYQKGPGVGLSSNSDLVKTLSSKVVPSMIAYGAVSKIDGRTLTLTYGTDSIVVPVAEGAQVFSFTQTTTGSTPTQKEANFSDIKVGNSINVSLKLLSNGNLQGTSVIILPTNSSAN